MGPVRKQQLRICRACKGLKQHCSASVVPLKGQGDTCWWLPGTEVQGRSLSWKRARTCTLKWVMISEQLLFLSQSQEVLLHLYLKPVFCQSALDDGEPQRLRESIFQAFPKQMFVHLQIWSEVKDRILLGCLFFCRSFLIYGEECTSVPLSPLKYRHEQLQ